ncbi:MAG: hypothetical protein H5T73_05075 [Actinobacteria bacterium]|nr:hypothetical protein [Actinomycetota bacterium]
MRGRGLGGLCAAMAVLALLAALLSAGCGNDGDRGERLAQVTEAATAFLDALGGLRVEGLREMFSRQYLEDNRVPDPLTPAQILASMGYLNSYRFLPDQDVVVEGDRAVINVVLSIQGSGEREETLAMVLEEGAWKVDGFTALDWSSQPPAEEGRRAQVEVALRDFLVACVDGDTSYIFKHLSKAYREKHRLEKPWTAAEFSGIFGTARSYDFKPDAIMMEDKAAAVDVTIEFGTRGNLESETSRVRLVREGEEWFVDAFPFFIY